ncbi:MAG TPA: hypothetical protein VFU05_13675 [Cyclobacteriaceae bacterium]|nr:hypothetical protein [Cyclobacteriaceae bacterium]
MIKQSLKEQLNSLEGLLHQLKDEEYTYRSTMLNQATIGQHVRHVIELVQCLAQAYEQGVVDYDTRKRDQRIENSRNFALQLLAEMHQAIDLPEKELKLVVNTGNGVHIVNTWYNREIFYNTEHATHHMALIRVALKEMQLNIVHDNFGIAYGTIRHKEKISAQV